MFEWLSFASGIVSVQFNTARHDLGLGYCESADEYTFEHDALRQRVSTELARFTMIWGALELLTGIICLDFQAPRKFAKVNGKINAACIFLGKYGSETPLPPGYLDELYALHLALIHDSPDQFKQAIHRHRKRAPRPFVGLRSLGLDAVYSLRNDFAHGSFGIPDPSSELTAGGTAAVIASSSRIVLFSVQMLLAARLQQRGLANEELDAMLDVSLDDQHGASAADVIGNLHLEHSPKRRRSLSSQVGAP